MPEPSEDREGRAGGEEDGGGEEEGEGAEEEDEDGEDDGDEGGGDDDDEEEFTMDGEPDEDEVSGVESREGRLPCGGFFSRVRSGGREEGRAPFVGGCVRLFGFVGGVHASVVLYHDG